MADPGVCCFVTKILCAHGGRMTLEELLDEIRLSEAQLLELLEAAGPDRFVLLETGDQAGITRSVVATTRARVCRRKYCQRPCDSLHLCKLNLLGRCHYAQSQRNLCKYSHDVLSEQNFQVLKNHELSGLNQEELAVLLVQSDPFFLPEICKSYKGEGRKQICGQPPPCERLHVCEHFTRGNCSYLNCLRSHNLMDRKVLAIMREHGLSSDVVQNIQDICNNKHTRRNPPGMRAPHPHRRGGPHRARSKSRDRFLHNSLEHLSTVSPLGSGPPSPDVTSCKDSLEDVSADITQKFKYLGTHDHAQVSSKAAGVRGPSQRRASQEFSENGDPDGLFSRNRSESSSSRASAACFPLDAAQRNEAVAMKMGVPSGRGMEVKGKNDTDHMPFLNSYIDEVTVEEATLSEFLGKRATANGLEEMMLPSNRRKSVVKPQDPQTSGRITDSGQDMAFLLSKYGEIPGWASTSILNAPNDSSQIMDEMPNVSKSTTGFGVKSPPVTGGKEAVYSGVQSLRSQVLAMPGETTTPVQGSSRLPQSPLSSSSHRVAASGSPTTPKNNTSASVSLASEPSRMTSDPDLLRYIVSPTSSMDDHGLKEICQDHLYKGCQQSNCSRSHFHLPYRWQVFMFTAWVDFRDMEYVEQAYCDPHVEVILIEKHQIDFQKMTCDSYPIRRLSTPSSVEKPHSSAFTTKWLWYWKNEFNEYIQYGDESPGHTHSEINSTYLESVFQSCPRGVLPFQAGSQKYELSFQGMIQTNIASKTQRHVVRRPVFVSSKDVEQKRRGPDHQPVMPQTDASPLYPLPQRSAITVPPNDYEFLELNSQDAEYVKISEDFRASMKPFKIVKIQRIWNQRLRDAFDRKKQKMKNKTEMLLFHAAHRTHVDYICRNNFEWVLHGNRETRYGKGNYFAKEAIYSHKNCLYETRNTVMFVARVLVGNVIEGNMTFSSPPALYDSCVDTRLNPSVFVIFRKEQIYPEYVIEYVDSEKEKGCIIS
ncbi:zinc finger CCCH-type antiviral protein 1 [Arvicanthis niloticus]|uniref:zinc finger CCCH-type antiviral protein 1 n=1 Tax=Arvicanthis niloticus TaxID=61156 RepID=UPI001486F16D|nr:zinc finger CCCH-type antiviral protein 1 isoform X2 [Arvicanthis niloticus]